jgi:hypothetical protein
VQGVCADCWGSKGGRQFWIRKQGPGTSRLVAAFGFVPFHALLALVAGAAAVGVLTWILG